MCMHEGDEKQWWRASGPPFRCWFVARGVADKGSGTIVPGRLTWAYMAFTNIFDSIWIHPKGTKHLFGLPQMQLLLRLLGRVNSILG